MGKGKRIRQQRPPESEDPSLGGLIPRPAPGQQILFNFLFKSGSELPHPQVINAYDPDVKAVILEGVRNEQEFRQNWLRQQQENDYKLNTQEQSQNFRLRTLGALTGAWLVSLLIMVGAVLIWLGFSFYGVALFVVAIGGVISTAIYGAGKKNTLPPEAGR
jgi:hypothetical protein